MTVRDPGPAVGGRSGGRRCAIRRRRAATTALEVRHAIGVEGHQPAPGATVVRPGRRQPWQVVTAIQPLGGLTMLSPWRQLISARLAGERPSWAEGPITCNNDT